MTPCLILAGRVQNWSPEDSSHKEGGLAIPLERRTTRSFGGGLDEPKRAGGVRRRSRAGHPPVNFDIVPSLCSSLLHVELDVMPRLVGYLPVAVIQPSRAKYHYTNMSSSRYQP